MRLNYGLAALLALGAGALAAPAVAQDQAPPLILMPAPPVAVPLPYDPPPRPSVITNPAWARQPMPRYPEPALAKGVEGRTRLECVVMPNGRLTECKLLLETPEGLGFGAEALAAARDTARVSPRTVDGAAVAARVTFNVEFRLGDPVVPMPPATPQP